MFSTRIATQIYAKICFETTPGQKKIIEKLSEYLADDDFLRIFVLNGYAGTGKTTLVAGLVGALKDLGIKPVLLAPTGRAAKVLAQYAQEKALTIHKRIYRQRTNADYESKFSLNINPERGAVFIVDEASMLSDNTQGGAVFGSGSLLSDLVEYVRSGRGCRLVLVGDSAQLPPVGADFSPALDPVSMDAYGGIVYGTMDEVVRQEAQSGILFNATLVRCMLENGLYEIPRFEMDFPDIEAVVGGEFLEKLQDCYARYGRDETIVITRSNKRANRLVLVGDSAQLPPVGADFSPALDPVSMDAYGGIVYGTMDEVVRQEAQSGILFNATLVRCMLENGLYEIPRFEMDFPDIEAVVGGEFLEKLQDCYARYGRDETIVITRSNKRANRYNEGIRRNVLYAEEEIESGDMLMVVKNNYYFPEHTEDCPMNFIANGDIARLKRLRRFEDFYGFRFADAVLEFPDYNDAEIECKILLDTIASESPSLTREESTRLFYEVEKDYTDIKSKLKRFKEIRENPHFNAVQVKFSYAVTCHKAQGGQWRAVFVDRCLFGDEPMSRDMLRWLYTALTRATDKLYLVNFDEKFYE